MKLFTFVMAFILITIAVMVFVLLSFVRRIIMRFRSRLTGEYYDEETFRRMADKKYGRNNMGGFDKDYFKSARDNNAKTNNSGNSSGTTSRTKKQEEPIITMDDGVTIIDEREMGQANRRIFSKDEGEYVDYQED